MIKGTGIRLSPLLKSIQTLNSVTEFVKSARMNFTRTQRGIKSETKDKIKYLPSPGIQKAVISLSLPVYPGWDLINNKQTAKKAVKPSFSHQFHPKF